MINLDRQQLSRRRGLALAGAAVAALVGAGCSSGGDSRTPSAPPSAEAASTPVAPTSMPGNQAWRALAEGNARFAAGKARRPHASPGRRAALAAGQQPIACVLGCADSRVPPELVFDQGLGDLFTVRSAGEVLDEAVLGSVEYAVAHAGTPLVVVLGHSGCGAVSAAVEAVQGDAHLEGNVAALVQAVEPAVRSVAANSELDPDDDAFVRACVAEQARRVATAITDRSSIIDAAVESGTAAVVPAVYDLASGRVARMTAG